MGYVLDTCIFNHLCDGKLSISDLPSDQYFVASSIQKIEIDNTTDSDRRDTLIKKFVEIDATMIPVESTVYGFSHFGAPDAHYGKVGKYYLEVLERLNATKTKKSNIGDALIAEIALANQHTLITADRVLFEVMENMQAAVIYFEV